MDLLAHYEASLRNFTDIAGCKVLLTDPHTVKAIGAIHTMRSLEDLEFWHVDRLTNKNRGVIPLVKAIVFVRPDPESLDALVNELEKPKYAEYYLCIITAVLIYHFIDFSNTLRREDVHKLAEADANMVVKNVAEIAIDYYPLMRNHFTLGLDRITRGADTWDMTKLIRCAQSLSSVLLSFSVNPIIRYDGKSDMAKSLVYQLKNIIKSDPKTFEFSTKHAPPVLIILDRMSDPVSPLITPWSYQAVIHELLGINNFNVRLPKERKSLTDSTDYVDNPVKLVGDSPSNRFFAENVYTKFDVMMGKVHEMTMEYAREKEAIQKKNAEATETSIPAILAEDMSKLHELQEKSTLHMRLVNRILEISKAENLVEISQLEQNIACEDSYSRNFVDLQKMFAREPAIEKKHKLRLALMFCLRFFRHASFNLPAFQEFLTASGLEQGDVDFIEYWRSVSKAHVDDSTKFGFGSARRVPGLEFNAESVHVNKHVPPVVQIVDNLVKGRLEEAKYPTDRESMSNYKFSHPNYPVHDVYVFVIGGTTYREAMCLDLYERAHEAQCRIMYGGTTCISSEQFIDGLRATMSQSDEFRVLYRDSPSSR